MKRECLLVQTFGVLLAGLFEAEKSKKRPPKRRRRARDCSGVFTLASLSTRQPPAF
jgi:hypothetical protein